MADDAAHTGPGPIDQQVTQLIQDLRTAHDNEQTTAFLEGYYSRCYRHHTCGSGERGI